MERTAAAWAQAQGQIPLFARQSSLFMKASANDDISSWAMRRGGCARKGVSVAANIAEAISIAGARNGSNRGMPATRSARAMAYPSPSRFALRRLKARAGPQIRAKVANFDR